MRHIFNLIVIFLIFATASFGQTTSQCDSIKVYNLEFDKLFQKEFTAIKSDTVLAIRHCFTTNGCSNTYGIFCWKRQGIYHFKKIEKKGQRVIYTQNLDQKLKKNLISFFEDEVYLAPDLDIKKDFYISDGSLTKVLYKTPSRCWNFSYRHTSPNSSDKRVLWLTKIENFIKIDGSPLSH